MITPEKREDHCWVPFHRVEYEPAFSSSFYKASLGQSLHMPISRARRDSGESGELLLARSWVLEEIEYQVSLSLLEEDVHNGSFLDSWTLVRIVAFVEPMTSRYYSTFSLQSVEVILYDTHGEVEFSFDLSKVGAWICLDELQYA